MLNADVSRFSYKQGSCSVCCATGLLSWHVVAHFVGLAKTSAWFLCCFSLLHTLLPCREVHQVKWDNICLFLLTAVQSCKEVRLLNQSSGNVMPVCVLHPVIISIINLWHICTLLANHSFPHFSSHYLYGAVTACMRVPFNSMFRYSVSLIIAVVEGK